MAIEINYKTVTVNGKRYRFLSEERAQFFYDICIRDEANLIEANLIEEHEE